MRRLLRDLLRDNRGVTALFVGLALLPLMAGVGLAVDSMQGYLIKTKLSKALDTAGLAAGRAAFGPSPEVDAEGFFHANFQADVLHVTVTNFSVTLDASKEFITVEAAVEMPTSFMWIFGNQTMTVSARTVIHRVVTGLELALVLDNTGSMRSGGKMDAMKAAAHELIDIVFGDNETVESLWVALVPYTATVNIGPERTEWLDPGDRFFDVPDPFVLSDWKGCVEARPVPFDSIDATPTAVPFASYFYAADLDNIWPPVDETNGAQNDGHGPNLGCGPAITPLIESKTDVHAAITEMLPWHRGGTAGNLGLAWGWRTVSPAWRDLWGGATPATLPLDYDTPLMEKVVVMLTDGQNQFYDWPGGNGAGPQGSDYTAYGRLFDFGFPTLDAARAELDSRMAATCQAMKDAGIILYTITFGPSPNASTQNLFRDCATTPARYFHAPSNGELADAFRTIGGQLSNLRIAE